MGPYETEWDTYGEPMVSQWRALHDTGRVRSGDPDHVARDAKLRHLTAACDESGVELGAYDRRILTWLAGGETSAAQVVVGLIRRAFAAGSQVHIKSRKHRRCHEPDWATSRHPNLL